MTDADRDLFRWCVHCGADCHLDPDDQEHAADCPFSTGLWPIEHNDALAVAWWVAWECEADVPADVLEAARRSAERGPACTECKSPFRPGDVYMLRDLDTGEIGHRPGVGLVVCIGCAAGPVPDGGGV